MLLNTLAWPTKHTWTYNDKYDVVVKNNNKFWSVAGNKKDSPRYLPPTHRELWTTGCETVYSRLKSHHHY